jgi:hypothetical protein
MMLRGMSSVANPKKQEMRSAFNEPENGVQEDY